MSPTEWTAILVGLMGFASTGVIPLLNRRWQARKSQERQSETSWENLTKMYKDRGDSLQARLDSRDEAYAARLLLVEADFENKIHDLEDIIKDLRELVVEQGKTIKTLRRFGTTGDDSPP